MLKQSDEGCSGRTSRTKSELIRDGFRKDGICYNCYNPRKRTGNNKTLIEKTVDLNDRDFLIRNLYKYSYWLVFLSSIAIVYFLAFYCSFVLLLFYYLPIHVIKLRMSTFNKRRWWWWWWWWWLFREEVTYCSATLYARRAQTTSGSMLAWEHINAPHKRANTEDDNDVRQ